MFLYVVNFSCSNIPSGSAEKQAIVIDRGLKRACVSVYLFILNREYQLVELKASIQMKTHEDINQQQKEYFPSAADQDHSRGAGREYQ